MLYRRGGSRQTNKDECVLKERKKDIPILPGYTLISIGIYRLWGLEMTTSICQFSSKDILSEELFIKETFSPLSFLLWVFYMQSCTVYTFQKNSVYTIKCPGSLWQPLATTQWHLKNKEKSLCSLTFKQQQHKRTKNLGESRDCKLPSQSPMGD